jgi:ABC-type glycerol-3-phosphate transport system substrate-binding protein
MKRKKTDMIRWTCIILALAIVAFSAIELIGHRTPLQVFSGREAGTGKGVTVIRLGIASWQVPEFPWAETIRRFEEAHGGRIRILYSTLPEDALNSMLLSWHFGRTEYDVIMAWADEEVFPFIDYNWKSPDAKARSLIIDVREYLSPEQLDAFVPAMFDGCSRMDPRNPAQRRSYELPWMGEVLALNYNREFFRRAGVKVPETWEDVEAACAKLKGLKNKKVEVAPLALNFAQRGFFAQNCYIPMLAAFKEGRGITDERGRLDVSSPECVRVFETLKRWYDAGYVSAHAFVSDDVEKDLKQGRAAIYPHWQSRGLWAVEKLGADNIGIAPTPGVKKAGSLIATYGCIIPKCSPVVRETVKACYEMFCTDKYGFQSGVSKGFPDPVTGVVSRGGKMPVLTSMYADPDMPEGIVALAPALQKGYPHPDPLNWALVSKIVVVEFQRYLDGTTATAEEALAKVRRRFDSEVYIERK